jgi:hypothetical protein
MQGVKLNAATVGLKNGVGQQMVKIHQHGGQQNPVSPSPLRLEQPPSEQSRENKVLALRAAIEKAFESPRIETFDFEANLRELKAKS